MWQLHLQHTRHDKQSPKFLSLKNTKGMMHKRGKYRYVATSPPTKHCEQRRLPTLLSQYRLGSERGKTDTSLVSAQGSLITQHGLIYCLSLTKPDYLDSIGTKYALGEVLGRRLWGNLSGAVVCCWICPPLHSWFRQVSELPWSALCRGPLSHTFYLPLCFSD